MENNQDPRNTFIVFGGASPGISTSLSNLSYTSFDGKRIYLNFEDIDSAGLEPSSGLELRFSVHKFFGAIASTITPSSTFIDPTQPKTLQLILSDANKIVDSSYNGSGIALTVQTVKVSYNATGFGSTVPKLSDNDVTKSFVASFTGVGITNLTKEANPPLFNYATTSTDGSKVYVYYTEATPPILPTTGISGFAITQSNQNVNILSGYVLDPSSPTNGKVVVLNLESSLAPSDGTNPVTISYTQPSSNQFKIRDSTGTGLTYAVSFSGSAVTNLISETIKPYVVSARTNTTAAFVFLDIYVTMSEPTLPGTSATGFSVYVADQNIYKTVDFVVDSNTTFGSIGVTQYTLSVNKSALGPTSELFLTYSKPVNDYITDQSSNLNQLDNFSNFKIQNLYKGFLPLQANGQYNATPSSTASYVDTTGSNIFLDFGTNKSYPSIPGSGITGFRVFIDGQSSPIKSSATGTTGSDHNVKLTLYNRIYSGSTVQVSLFNSDLQVYGASGYGTVNNFEPVTITNRASYDAFGFFDTYDWNAALGTTAGYGFEITDDYTDVLVKSEFYPNASVIYDTTPPRGIAIYNKKSDDVDPGIKVHYFSGLGYSSLTVTEENTIVDYSLSTLKTAFKIYSTFDQNITTINLKLKRIGSFLNLGDKISLNLYSTDTTGDNPLTLLGSFGSIQVDSLTSTYDLYSFSNTGLSLTADTYYWVEVLLDNLPIAVTGNVYIYLATHVLEGNELAYYDDTDLTWVRLANTTAYNKLTSFLTTSAELQSTDLLLDIYETPIKQVSVYGGSTDLSKYEVLGNKQFNYLLKKFNKVYEDPTNPDNDIYPTVTNLIVGATARNTKTYIVQIKETRTSEWVDIFENIADVETLDFLNFAFDTPTSLYAARIVYKGDYFTIDQRADLTISAYDELSDVVSAQISRFEDFRDAKDFENADTRGFIDFTSGETTYTDIDLTNAKYLWSKQTGNSVSEINAIETFGDKILIAANNKMYVSKNDTVYPILNEALVDERYQITDIHVFNGKAYAGSNSGLLFVSFNGEFWSVVNAKQPLSASNYKTIKPITCLTSIGNDLYIGTSKGTSSSSSIYKYDGQSLLNIKDFSSYDKVTSMSAKDFTLYVGLGGGYGYAASSIYKYYNSEWNQTVSTNFDSVDALANSFTRSSVLAAFRGGQIWELTFDGNVAKSWSKIYDTYADRVFGIYDDPNSNYVYIVADNGVFGYFKSINGFKKVVSHPNETNQLINTWRSYTASTGITWTDVADIESYNYISGTAQTTAINYGAGTAFTYPASFTNPSLMIEGAIKAEQDGTCTFRVDSSVGYNLFLNDTLQISNFKSTSSLETNYSTNTFTLLEGDFVKFKLHTYNNVGTGSTLAVYWKKNSNQPYELIPSTQFYGPNKMKAMTAIGNTFYGASQDGSIFEFTTTPYEDNTRNVYVRFKDQAGNIQGVVLPANDTAYPIIKDKLLQTSNVSNNPSSFVQNEVTNIVSNTNTTINTVTGDKQNSNTNSQTQSQINANTTASSTTNTAPSTTTLSTTNNNGVIYQIQKNSDNSLSRKGIYVPPSRLYPVYAPDRKVREIGIYEPQPIYVPTLIAWTQLAALILNKYPVTPDTNLDNGTQVKIYIKSGNTRSECLAASYGEAETLSTVNDIYASTSAQTLNIDLSSYSGKWLQYKVELITASKNITPELLSVAISYTSSTGSYFFTRMFDTENYDTDAPLIKRGLLTSNELKNNGSIVYGYTTSDDSNETYNFDNFTIITPNKTFELSQASSKIRFGILLTSVGSNPSMVYDFAVQLDIGDANIKFMPSL
jgi:hypothetical protein